MLKNVAAPNDRFLMVCFWSSKAHVALRQTLVDNNQLEAVISLRLESSNLMLAFYGILVFTKGARRKTSFL